MTSRLLGVYGLVLLALGLLALGREAAKGTPSTAERESSAHIREFDTRWMYTVMSCSHAIAAASRCVPTFDMPQPSLCCCTSCAKQEHQS